MASEDTSAPYHQNILSLKGRSEETPLTQYLGCSNTSSVQAFYASEVIWAASIPIIKISILLLYIRIFGRLRYFKAIAYLIGVFSICWSIMVILVCSFQCQPIQFIWDKSIEGGKCIDAPLFFIIGSAPNVVTDFVLLALPLPAVWNLHTTRAQKISLTAIFLLGSL